MSIWILYHIFAKEIIETMEKHYTPESNEFYLGFEFEVWQNKDWRKTSLMSGGHLDEGVELEEGEENVRVKYLDEEDIESLGFSQNPNGYELGLLSRTEWGVIQGDEMIKIQTYWTYDIEERENLVRIYKGTKYDYPYTEIFRGDIKNKSELKKTLKQLRIL